jgi:hypothetical protein
MRTNVVLVVATKSNVGSNRHRRNHTRRTPPPPPFNNRMHSIRNIVEDYSSSTVPL